jgi:hypothetical protein
VTCRVDWILQRFAREHHGPVLAGGWLRWGGNALMRWSGGGRNLGAAPMVASVASVWTWPQWLGGPSVEGFNRLVYTRMF